MFVPPIVPSDLQSSSPCTPSSAMKYNTPPIVTIAFSDEVCVGTGLISFTSPLLPGHSPMVDTISPPERMPSP